jgi:hypothetical protein
VAGSGPPDRYWHHAETPLSFAAGAPADDVDNYKFASRLQWVGTVQATDKGEAIEKAAKEFGLDPAKLMAERRP